MENEQQSTLPPEPTVEEQEADVIETSSPPKFFADLSKKSQFWGLSERS